MCSHVWKSLRVGAIVTALAMLSTAALAQQQPRQPGTQPGRDAQRAPEQRQDTSGADRAIAQMLGIAAQEEIAQARLAQEKSENSQVKEFAEMMVRDHTQQFGELERFGAKRIDLKVDEEQLTGKRNDRDAAQRDPARQADPGQREGGQKQRQPGLAGRVPADSQRTGVRDLNGLDLLEVSQQVAQRGLNAARQQWEELEPETADVCFVGAQIVLHQRSIDAHKVLKQHASPELQEVIDKGISTAETHMDHAKTLMKELAGHDTDRG